MIASSSFAVGDMPVVCPPSVTTCLNESIVFSGDYTSLYGCTAGMWGGAACVPVTIVAAVETSARRWDGLGRTGLSFLDKLGRKGGTFCAFGVKGSWLMVWSRHVARSVIRDMMVNAGLTR